MTQGIRVRCGRCGVHRDVSRAPRCLVCGFTIARLVEPTKGDLETATANLVAAAEAVDVEVIQRGAVVGVAHPALQQLRTACRRLALARAGVLEM